MQSASVPQATLSAIRAVVDAIASGNISAAAIGRAAKLSGRHVSYASTAAAVLDLVKPDGPALLLMPAEHDTLLPIESVRAAFDRASEPKALAVLPIKHFDAYREPWLPKAADTAIDWFRKYL